MKQVIVNVPSSKYKFFLELMESLDFVSVQNSEAAREKTLQQIAEGMHVAVNASKGKTTARPAKDFLNEL